MNVANQFAEIEENTMRLLRVLHNHVLNSVPSMHAARAVALVVAVQSLVEGAFLTVTALGRGLRNGVASKHNIKRVDRLLSNPPSACRA